MWLDWRWMVSGVPRKKMGTIVRQVLPRIFRTFWRAENRPESVTTELAPNVTAKP